MKLKPANFISIDLNNINLFNYKEYWNHQNYNFQFVEENSFINELDKKLELTIKRMIISDRKIGSFLSGGIDSS